MALANPTPGSLLFLYNAKRHYVVPSKHNTFGGYTVERIILDTGCSSVLLPIPTAADLITLMTTFPTATHTWRVRTANNAGPLKSRTLEITRNNGHLFPVVLCGNTPSPYNTSLAKIRFSLCKQDAQDLLASTLAIAGRPRLTAFVDEITLLETHIPGGVTIAPRRNYALFGQDLLRNVFLLQDPLLAFVHPGLPSLPTTPAAITAHYNAGDSWVPLDFNMATQEFDFVDDIEHEETEYDDYLLEL